MKTKILITGAAGFVGTKFSRHLLDQGYSVIGYDVEDRLGRLKSSGLLSHSSFVFNKIDLAESIPESVGLEDVKVIFHFAALPHVDYSSYFPVQVITNNIQSLLHTIDLALKLKRPLVFSSSVEVYGGNTQKIYQENDVLEPLSPYAASKVACEAIIQSYIETKGLQASIFRFTNLYGPWQAPDRLVPRVISQLLINHGATIEKGTDRDFVYIDDACKVLEKSIKFNHDGEVYNLSSGKKIDNFEVAELILKFSTNKEIVTIEPRSKDGRGKYLVSDPSKLTSKIGWKPKVSLEDGIKSTYLWYKKNLEWVSQFNMHLKSERNNKNFLIDSSTWRS